MLKLTEYIKNENLLVDHLATGVVEVRHHNTLPLSIYCYGKRATFETLWDEVTCKTRGLIVRDETLDIIARPFEKFFNVDTSFRPETAFSELAKEPFVPHIQDKLDGSMGTYWSYEGRYGIATKGSFHSEQAEWATAWIHNHYENEKTGKHTQYWVHPWTPVFEIITQKVQHHVVHYGPHEDNKLVLIGMCNRQSGEELLGSVLAHQGQINGIEVAQTASAVWTGSDANLRTLIALQQYTRPNREGFVMSFARSGKPPLKVKIKHDDFLRLQRIAHYTTPKVVFEYCKLGNWDEINTVIRDASPYLSNQVKEWVTNYQNEYDRISKDARYWVTMAPLECTTRKEYAAFFHQEHVKPMSAVCFNMLDEKCHTGTIWDLVEPLVKQQKFSEVEAEG